MSLQPSAPRCDFVPPMGEGSRCRNKAQFPWPGNPRYRLCTKHRDYFMHEFERRDPWLAWYLGQRES